MYSALQRLRQPMFARSQQPQPSTSFGPRTPAFVGGRTDRAAPGLQAGLQVSQGIQGRIQPFGAPKGPASSNTIPGTMSLQASMQGMQQQMQSQRMGNANQRVSRIATTPRSLSAASRPAMPWRRI